MQNIVTSDQITVVIQGPLFRNSDFGDGIALTVASIIKQLPCAEIIVSTWSNEEVGGLESVSRIILSDLPEAMIDSSGNTNNFGRQLISTLKGIENASRPYVLKIRADHLLKSKQIFSIPSLVSSNHVYGYFSQKITITSFFVRDHLKVPFLFHVSDLVQFGSKRDMLRFWSSTIPSQESLQQRNPQYLPRLFGNFAGVTSFREAPEQTLTRLWLEREGLDIHLDFPCATSFRLFSLWENVLVENFNIVNFHESGIQYPDRFHAAFLGKKTVISEAAFRIMQANPGSVSRYAKLLLSKYFTCWFVPRYWVATANVMVSKIMPRLARSIRAWLRTKLGLTHPGRR